MSLQPLAHELGTTDRTLRRSVRSGLVRARRPSPRTVEIGVDERVYLRKHWSDLARLRRALRTEPGVRAAVLFGSLARGDDRADSDVDLLVELREAAPAARVDLRHRLEAATGRSVQLVETRSAERSPVLLAEILRDGRPLVDRAGLWPALQSRRAAVERAARAEAQRRAKRLRDLAASRPAA
jgi:predicted nucleotidyltransferase